MATAATTPAAAAPAAATTPEVVKPFGTLWNTWVDGTFNRLVTQLDLSKTFSLRLEKEGDNEAHGTAWKVVKMFVLVVPMIAFTAIAAVGTVLSSIKNCFSAAKEEAKVGKADAEAEAAAALAKKAEEDKAALAEKAAATGATPPAAAAGGSTTAQA